MPLVFTKDQIRRYLVEMGFSELDDQYLDLFIRDLKKLIRHEDKKRRIQRIQLEGLKSSSEASPKTIDNPDTPSQWAAGPPVHTDTSTSYKSPPSAEVTPRSQYLKRQEKSSILRSTILPGKSPSSKPSQPSSALATTASTKSWSKKRSETAVELSSSDSSIDSTSSSNSTGLKTNNHFFERTKYIGRSDPVARYHFYKYLWDKQKPPGDDRHMQLRWNVRAGTMGKVPCDPFGARVKYLR